MITSNVQPSNVCSGTTVDVDFFGPRGGYRSDTVSLDGAIGAISSGAADVGAAIVGVVVVIAIGASHDSSNFWHGEVVLCYCVIVL
jgi:hypothetical protein